jgi:D-alanyl-D-alanine carboxypeptidase
MRTGRRLALALGLAAAALAGGLAVQSAQAAPYAAYVMDARTGEVLHSRSAERRLHPASLTKMMTMYLAIEAVKDGRLSLDQGVPVSRRAARQPPSKIWLRAGSRVSVRHLMRATAVKSANDAAVALAEATVGGSVEDWARLANAKARLLGMTDTTFRNPHGLTQSGHLSTARDMAILGRRLFFDFPEYYNLFGRTKTHAFGKLIRATNRRLLNGYPGADGIKTGYTNAAGFNLVASARRGQEHVIAAVFGGRSSADRDRKVRRLLDMGFARSPSRRRRRRRRRGPWRSRPPASRPARRNCRGPARAAKWPAWRWSCPRPGPDPGARRTAARRPAR